MEEQTMDPFDIASHDMDFDGGFLADMYPPSFDEVFLDQNSAIPEHSSSFLDGFALTGSSNSFMNEDLSMFLADADHVEIPAGYEDLTDVQQIMDPNPNNVPLTMKLEDPTKRKFEEGLSQFVGVENRPQTKRRKAFAPDRRKEVDQVRKVGACLRCRITRTRCKLDLPCATCLQLGKSPSIARALCVRQKLLDVRFTADLYGRARDVEWLGNEVTTLYGPKILLRISAYDFCDASPSVWNTTSHIWAGGEVELWKVADPLVLEVQAFNPRPQREHQHVLDGHIGPSNVVLSSSHAELPYYAIPEPSLPSLETLENWALETTKHHRRALVGGFQGSFLSLAREYCECQKTLPLSDLVWKTVRISCLYGIWGSDLKQPRQSRQVPKRYVSSAVSRQVGVIVAKGIIDLEVETLAQLQKIVFSSKGPGKNNMLPIWTCLWLLLLNYRDINRHWRCQSVSQEGLPELSQHMYDMLVSIYSGLFRPSSPLWLNWLKSDVLDLFGRDTRIIERMGNLKTEMGLWDADASTYAHPGDKLLRSLIFEHEKKLGRKFTKRPEGWDSLVKKHLNFSGTDYHLVRNNDGTQRPRNLADPHDGTDPMASYIGINVDAFV